ncbi:MAG: hypothetical protein RLZZ117_1345 [Cyanobacteriota bacterium]|jgi:hypothetical protein
MATKLTRAPHLPRFPRPGVLVLRSPRSRRTGVAAFPGPSLHPAPTPAQPAPGSWSWRRQALREGVLATLLTSLLTSAVWAAPEVFRQSPAVSWRQFASPALILDQPAEGGVLLDCP